MTDKELFNEVLNSFIKKYNLDIIHPYNDSYIKIYQNEKMIGDLNSDGYCLLRNLSVLCMMLEHELI